MISSWKGFTRDWTYRFFIFVSVDKSSFASGVGVGRILMLGEMSYGGN